MNKKEMRSLLTEAVEKWNPKDKLTKIMSFNPITEGKESDIKKSQEIADFLNSKTVGDFQEEINFL